VGFIIGKADRDGSLLDDQKVPGPGHYNIKTSGLTKNGAKIPKSKRDQLDLNGPGPGPG
jgi:hypothetical protein